LAHRHGRDAGRHYAEVGLRIEAMAFGGWWNENIMHQLKDTEVRLGRRLTPQEIIQVGKV
jgi:hypothetical protein